MIKMSGRPSLSTLVLTRGGDINYTYLLPSGMHFPEDTTAELVLTDLSGDMYDFSPYPGVVNDNKTGVSWQIEAEYLNHVPAGANFEAFVSFGGSTYKVRYGRVARNEVSHPLVVGAALPPEWVYSDDMQRSMPGPRWLVKQGRVSMHDRGSNANPRWAMASRNAVDIFGAGLLFGSSATLWYAPLQSDDVEINAGLLDRDEGAVTLVFASNTSLTSYLGVRFEARLGTDTEYVQVVTGSAWDSWVKIGTEATTSIPDNGGVYKITYTSSNKTVKVYSPGAGTPFLTTAVSTNVTHGMGYRYCGAYWNGTFLSTGPRLYSWSIGELP